MSYLLTAKYKLVAAAKKFFSGEEEGAAMVEYGLLVGLIAAICVLAITALGGTISSYFVAINDAMAGLRGQEAPAKDSSGHHLLGAGRLTVADGPGFSTIL